MKTLRTPDERFADLKDFPFEPNYAEIPDGEGGTLRIHYLDEGSRTADPILLMHGNPAWCYLYRKMIPILVNAGHRVIAVDLVGFGRSDKPSEYDDYTYQRHVGWMQQWLELVDLNRITLFCQDWGGMIGLRLVAANQDRFARVVASNTSLPTGNETLPQPFLDWQIFSRDVEDYDLGIIIAMGSLSPIPEEVIAAYNAPFPDETYKAGARIFASLVPHDREHPAFVANRKAWKNLQEFKKPFLTAFSDSDPMTKGAYYPMQKKIPGAAGQPHMTIKGVGHFTQEERGEEMAEIVIDFIKQNPINS
ncbi:MAG: haloalkane dehalogenase [Deltaproteobacteria bacterium]|jgi:haloalkane dehalogenase|nr:haloalkane dehalogenase [Deltaproteobacteria bacterium]MBT6498616.1 haloalkane dehalogenase [Deltaproteobacteria bacterium]MBT7154281.1 haloalkane dehalogenase [Deltaproteobacteria bacterium]MBT7715831.1 haloalkane dehalogenase [Deltaproteobacteria bacterium]